MIRQKNTHTHTHTHTHTNVGLYLGNMEEEYILTLYIQNNDRHYQENAILHSCRNVHIFIGVVTLAIGYCSWKAEAEMTFVTAFSQFLTGSLVTVERQKYPRAYLTYHNWYFSVEKLTLATRPIKVAI